MNPKVLQLLVMDGVSDKLLLSKIIVELFRPDVVPKVRAVSLLNLLGTESKNARDIAFAIAAGFICDKHLAAAFAIELSEEGISAALTRISRPHSPFDIGRFLGALKGLALLHEHSLELLLSGEECAKIENTLIPTLEVFLFWMEGEEKFSGGNEGLLSEVVTELVEKNPTFVRVFLTRIGKLTRLGKKKALEEEVYFPLAVQVVNEFAYKAFGRLLSVSERARAVSEYLAKRATA